MLLRQRTNETLNKILHRSFVPYVLCTGSAHQARRHQQANQYFNIHVADAI